VPFYWLFFDRGTVKKPASKGMAAPKRDQMHRLLTPEEMNIADRFTVDSGTPVLTLMERAGRAVADHAMRLCKPAGRVIVLCGPGNNGGDGFVAARILAGRGYQVDVATLDGHLPDRGDAGVMAGYWKQPLLAFPAVDFDLYDLCVDAIFGAGLSRDVAGRTADCLHRLAESELAILAVDVPSGVDGESGQKRGFAVRASLTVSFFRQKPGHCLQPGRDLCGEVVLADIGIDSACLDAIDPKTMINLPAIWQNHVPLPATTSHKYQRGAVLVLSNRLEYSGAARLSAKAALRGGAGLVTLATPVDAMTAHAASSDAIMLRRCETLEEFAALLADTRRNALVIGPGLGAEGDEAATTRAFVRLGIGAKRALVLDASALTVFAGRGQELADMIAQSGYLEGFEPIVTPHEGEFAHLVKDLAGHEHHASKCTRARALSRLLGCVVVYKGADTVIAAPDGRAAINVNGTAWLSTAGSGDVLSGLVAAFCAGRMPSFEAACMSVWCHAQAGLNLGPYLTADDLPRAITQVLRDLLAPQSVR